MSSDPSPPPAAPGGRPVVGHTLSVLRGPLTALERWGRTDDDVVRATIAGRPFCLVTGPAAIGQILATDADSYRKAAIVRERLGRLQGGSLVLLEGEQWRDRRQLLQSGFGRQQVQAAAPLTTRYAGEVVESWPTGRPVRADCQARTLSLSILARALFGLDLRGERTPIHEAADAILARLNPRSPSAHLPDWVPTPTNYRYRRAVSKLHDRLDAVIAETTAATGNDSPTTSASSVNVLSLMLAAGLPPERVRDELIALLFAGYDSTATALSLTLGLLGDNPSVQADLRADLDAALGDAVPTPDGLEEVPLLDAVVRESLRLYPPQYILFREPERAVRLQGYRIEPGTTVVLPPWVLQRDPRYWDDPTEFRPRRWLGEDATAQPEFSYFPYGGGPRHCLGSGLATQTLRLVVAVVCRDRRLALDGSLSVRAGPTLSPDPIELRADPL